MSQKQYAYFSAAIRDGAKLRPQAFGNYFFGGASCAIGAGAEAMGLANDVSGAECFYDYMFGGQSTCPVSGCCELSHQTTFVYLVQHLNDVHRWTREAIADWLYAEEEKLGFITISEEAEAHKPQMIAEFETVKATVQSLS